MFLEALALGARPASSQLKDGENQPLADLDPRPPNAKVILERVLKRKGRLNSRETVLVARQPPFDGAS